MTTVINLFGAPGSGKSTVASGLFYHLKLAGMKVEWADEYVKAKLFEEAPYPFKDQLYTFAKQNKKIRQLCGKVDYVVCDSPLLLSLIYQKDEPKIFNQTVLEYFNQYDNINFLLKRTHKYHNEGRFQNEQESDKIANEIEKKLIELEVEYTLIPTNKAMDSILKVFDNLEDETLRKLTKRK